MSRFQPHGARILCVAGSEGELPEAVRRWLDQVAVRAEYSADVYDALAVLATGTRPILLIVSIESVDWNELDFFGHAAALSRGTRIYVAAQDTGDSRVFAAAERGARLFDSVSAQADIETVTAEAQASGPGGLLAGTLRPSRVSRVPINLPTPATKDEQPPASEAGETKQQEPPIRLVTRVESEEGDEPQVSVPWAPHPSRPRRTPPGTPNMAQPPADTASGGMEPDRPLPRVELTPDEIAALLGKPGSPPPRLREQGS